MGDELIPRDPTDATGALAGQLVHDGDREPDQDVQNVVVPFR